jgi:YesN/AraC family two-component response regulator
MRPEERDKPVRDLIANVFLPPDLCPNDPAAIESMLDALTVEPLDEEQIERMLKKARGELPVGEREEKESEWCEDALTDQENELLALHRNGGEELPPEIQEKLRRLREQAKKEDASEDECDDLDV